MRIPEILEPYLKDVERYRRGNFVNDSNFLAIATNYVEWYNKNKKDIIENLFEVYQMTGYETGYDALSTSWERMRSWKKVVDKKKDWYTKEKCEEIIFDKMRAAILHLYQRRYYGEKTADRNHRSGAIGLLVSATIIVDITKSEKRDTMDINYSFFVKVNLEASNNNFLEVHEDDI
jgi:hypothetical protein